MNDKKRQAVGAMGRYVYFRKHGENGGSGMKKVIIPAIEIIVLTLLVTGFFVLALMWVTAPEQWYAGQHDSQHEGNNCHCYERLVASTK